jgi:hypothetical protein
MANPTYQSGFYAPGRGTAKYPELWRGCVGAWNPGLGNTGLSCGTGAVTAEQWDADWRADLGRE